MFDDQYQVGDCLLSDNNSECLEDQDQLEVIEDQIHKRLAQVTDLKKLNEVA